jgi:hypothetical protein
MLLMHNTAAAVLHTAAAVVHCTYVRLSLPPLVSVPFARVLRTAAATALRVHPPACQRLHAFARAHSL